MAYCKSCGAYIPDGQTVCLACGFDEDVSAKKKQGKSNSGKAYSFQNEELRQKLEEQRRQQQEQSKKWAEEQYARRQQQEENRRWAQEEYARRQAEQQANRQSQSAQTRANSPLGGISFEGNKALAALSYLSILFVLPHIFAPEDRFAKFHARQGLKLFIFSIIADVVGGITGFGWVITLLRLYFIYKRMSAALNGKEEPLPWIGTIGDNDQKP